MPPPSYGEALLVLNAIMCLLTSVYRAVDINLAACKATKETLMSNCVSAPRDVLCMDLVSHFTK